MKILISTFCFFYVTMFNCTLIGQTIWSQNYSNSSVIATCDFIFVNSNTGYAYGTITGNNGFILKTTNSGLNWGTPLNIGSGAITSISFPSENTGYAVGWFQILKTTDGGNTWFNLTKPTSSWLSTCFFTDDNTGLVCGDFGAIYRTVNGGNNWTYINISNSSNINSIKFSDSNNGWLAGNEGMIKKTTDGGVTWNVQNSKTGNALGYLRVIDADVLYCMYSGVNSGAILKTTNGGANWNTFYNFNYQLINFYFPSGSVVYAIGNVSNNLSIQKSTNMGINWSSESYETNGAGRSLYFIDLNTGFIGLEFGTFLKRKENSLDNGMVAYYPFNGNTLDESGFGNHGINNNASWTTDRFNKPDKALQFNGVSNWIDILFNNSLEFGSGDFSVFAWTKTSSSSFKRVVSKGECFSTGWQLGCENKIRPSFQSPPNGPVYPQSNNSYYDDGNWHLIGFTRKSGIIQIWGDGTPDGNPINFPYTMSNNSEPITIGRCRASAGSCDDAFFTGKIDDIRIYNRALTDNEVSEIYNEAGTNNSVTLNLTSFIDGFYYLPFGLVQDSINIYLRQAVSPFLIADSAKAVLDINGNAIMSFVNAATGIYYIVVKHRNSIETWSKPGGESFTNGDTTFYDFSVSNTQAYGNNLKMKGIKYCIFSGDVNQNGFIDLDDIILIYNDASSFKTGYINTDVTGDDITDLSDLTTVYNNSAIFVSLKRP